MKRPYLDQYSRWYLGVTLKSDMDMVNFRWKQLMKAIFKPMGLWNSDYKSKKR